MANTPATPTPVTVPDLTDFDPSAVLTAQITELETKRDELAPVVEAFNTIEGMIARLIEARDGKPVKNSDRADRGARPDQFLAVVAEAGDKGIKIADAARAMGMSGPNYLYRIAPELVAEGKVRKDGDKYFSVTPDKAPAESAASDKTDSE
jgi:hypothetical protein